MKRVNKVVMIGLMLALAFAGSGCVKKTGKPAAKQTAKKSAFPLTVKDEANRTVDIKKAPKRIVSLSPSNTEILFALGLGGNIVGVDDFSDYPKAALKIEKVGGFAKPNIEKIVVLKPDLVLAAGSLQEETVGELERLNISVFLIESNKVADVVEAIKNVGRITGKAEAARKAAREMSDKIDKITAKTKNLSKDKRPKVFYELYKEPLMSAGPGTFIDDMITLAGGENIAGSTGEGYPRFSLEKLIDEDPRVYIAASGSMTDPGDLNKRPGWENLTALKDGRVYVVDENLINRPGPRIVEGLASVAAAVHPELFKESEKNSFIR